MSDPNDRALVWAILSVGAADDDELRGAIFELRRQGYSVEVRVSWEDGHTAGFTDQAIDAGADAILACGGDGTLHEVVGAIMKADDPPILAGLPYGTGNDFLGALGIDDADPEQQLPQWLTLEPTLIDVACAEGRYFLNMASAGVGAEVTAEASPRLKEVAGSLAYFFRAIPAAFDIPTHRGEIEGDDLSWSGELAFLFVGNGPQTGGGWRVCPAAKINDGLLDVVIVPSMPLNEMARCARELNQAAQPGDYGDIIYRQVNYLSTSFDDPIPLNLDGEPLDGDTFEFSITAGALPFLVP